VNPTRKLSRTPKLKKRGSNSKIMKHESRKEYREQIWGKNYTKHI